MNNKFKRIIVLLLLCSSTLWMLPAVNSPFVSYTLYFTKSPKNTFYFSDPHNPTVEYSSSSTGGGVQFSIPDKSVDGQPSNATIGIYYNLESKAVLKVWFNSSINHDDAYRMKVGTTSYDYLNFLIGIADNFDDAKAVVDNHSKGLGFDGGAPDNSAKEPAITIYSHEADPNPDPNPPKGYEQKATFYENTGSKVMCMQIKQPKKDGVYSNYMGGQYQGYVIMELTTL